MDWWILFFIILAIAVLVAICLSLFLEKKRTKDLRIASQSSGFTFWESADSSVVKAQLDVFRYGYDHKFFNVAEKQVNGRKLTIFDYSYSTGAGRDRHSLVQTMAVIDLDRVLPVFSICPENFLTKLAEKFSGAKDINFPSNPIFSKMYILKGDDEAGIRRVFSPGILSFFEQQQKPNFVLESGQGQLVYYVLVKRVKPTELNSLAETLMRIASQFER